MRISDWSSDVCSSDLQIWVSGGCRAEFRYGYANNGGYPTPLPQPVKDYAGTIRCESRNNGYQQCNVVTNDRVELVRLLGGRCNVGRPWGYTSSLVWVNNGFRAEFGDRYCNVRSAEHTSEIQSLSRISYAVLCL